MGEVARRFLSDTRGAVGLASAFIALAFIAGAALVTDHLWLVGKRDTLKYAADAATVAATLELANLTPGLTKAEAEAALLPLAKRYVRLNLLATLSAADRAQLKKTLEVEVDVNRGAGLVDVTARAALNGLLLSPLLGYDGPAGSLEVGSRVEAAMTATEIVLALDTTTSMLYDLDRNLYHTPDSRLEIVREAALDLVDILAAQSSGGSESSDGSGGGVAFGIVPWSYRVRLNSATRELWQSKDWVVYPEERFYPYPPSGKGPATYANPETQPVPARNELPKSCRNWYGCLDQRQTFGEDGRLVEPYSTALPSEREFTMNFFTDQTIQPEREYVSYACQAYDRRAVADNPGWEKPECYDLSTATSDYRACAWEDIGPHGPWRHSPQYSCEQFPPPEILPLTSNLDTVRAHIRALEAPGSATYSALGVLWGARLLDPAWKDAWGDAVHPMTPTQAKPVEKIIVLLTDGEDNRYSNAEAHRAKACSEAKAAGVKIFVIAAMDPSHVDDSLATSLEACSSQADDPDGTYVFLNNATPENLKNAFLDIGQQLLVMRRVH